MKTQTDRLIDEFIAEDPIEHQKIWDDVSADLEFACKLKDARLSMKMDQKELASITGIRQSEISKIENAVISPTIRTIGKYLSGLGLTLDIKPISSLPNQNK